MSEQILTHTPGKNTAENSSGRDAGGRFAKGCPAGPGRPKGSANSVLVQARQWVAEKGLPMMIQAAEMGDVDALKCIVTLAMPRQKPAAPPLDGLKDMPQPRRLKDLGKLASFLLEKIAAGQLAVADAESLMVLAKRSVDWQGLGQLFRIEDLELL